MDGSNPPQPSRVLATPVSEHFGDENNGDTDNDAPPPRRKPSAASNPNPRASATQVKSSVSKPNAIAKSKENPLLCEAGTEARRSRSQTQTIIAAAAALSTSQSSASLPPSVVDQPKNKADEGSVKSSENGEDSEKEDHGDEPDRPRRNHFAASKQKPHNKLVKSSVSKIKAAAKAKDQRPSGKAAEAVTTGTKGRSMRSQTEKTILATAVLSSASNVVHEADKPSGLGAGNRSSACPPPPSLSSITPI